MIFRNHCGTADETYLAFKSGPNRGHYHGDQLSIHWCADAEPLPVDRDRTTVVLFESTGQIGRMDACLVRQIGDGVILGERGT